MMAEIRCPMCGKLNPSDRDTCIYCQARLKSLTGLNFTANDNFDSSFGMQSKPETGGDDLPDWLKEIRDGDLFSKKEENEPLPAWITGESSQGFDESEQLNEIEVPDWLNNLRQEGEKVHTSALSEDKLNKLPIDDEPDWLRKIRLGQEEEVFPKRRPEIPSEHSISSFSERKPQIKPEEEIISSDVPDWVVELSEKSVISSEPLPDSGEKEVPGEEIQYEHKEEEGSLLAWLSTLEEDSAVQVAPAISTPDKKAAELDQRRKEILFSSELSDLFSGSKDLSFESEPKEPLDIHESQEEKPAEESQKAVSPFTSAEGLEGFGDLPDWLGGIPAEETAIPEIEPSVTDEKDLTPASLPNWLEAYAPAESIEKPVEKIPPIELPRKVESAGPLAGLSSVLPAEPDIAKSRKPIKKPDILEVTEKQRHQISVFETLLSSEGIPEIVGEKPIIAPSNIFRTIIFVVLCLGIIGVIVSGYSFADIPTPPVETLDTFNILNSISNGAPVLLAIDYQPGYTGEMEAGVSIILDHLMVKGAYLAMVSTNPTGPAQIERLVAGVNREKNHHYTVKEQYVTLGYIPGGTTGLSGFAIQPRRIFNQGADGKPVWGISWLNNINKISDFSLVIVATNNPDTARAWLEQVQPFLENKPLLMVVSAQAEPMVRPYYENTHKQVNGLVVGLMGGAAYEQIINRPGAAVKYWSSFNAAIIIAMIMILLGSVYMILMTLKNQPKDIPQEGQG